MTAARPNPKRVNLLVHVEGRVQGVMFRASAAERARELGLDGSVSNLDDGRVKLEVEGDFDRVSRLVDWCHEGPGPARVDAVTTTERPLQGIRGFDIS